jgi:putative phosphoribosyl transferase
MDSDLLMQWDMNGPRFRDRRDAGRQLAAKLAQYESDPNVIVLGLPRGGVPVAFEIAAALHVLLDVFVVRKLGVPDHRELAMGAIASGGVRVLNRDVVDSLQISPMVIDAIARQEQIELERQERLYRSARSIRAASYGTKPTRSSACTRRNRSGR